MLLAFAVMYDVTYSMFNSIFVFLGILTSKKSETTVINNINTSASLRSSQEGENSILRSSGYFSIEDSSELEESYVKVSKLTGNESEPESKHYGLYKEYKEMQLQQQLANEIKCIVEQETPEIVTISDYLTLRTAGDVVNLSKCEPYGLKGCKLIIIIEGSENLLPLGCIYPEKGIISTFEITLVLHLRKHPCKRIPLFNCKPRQMQITEHYELRKEKLYTGKQRRVSPPLKKL